MPVSIVHNHVSAIPNDPTKDVSSDRWNEAHSVTGLGTAAEADTGDFATAAQGALADSAMQAADVDAKLIFVTTTTANALADDTSSQPIFPSGNDALTVEASTTYFFEAVIRVTNGTTTHTDSFGFGGTATFTSIGYDAITSKVATGGIAAVFVRRWGDSAAMSTISSGTGGTTAGVTATIHGTIRVANAGTIIPQWAFSSAPGGTNQVEPNSYIQLRKVGADTVASAGAWA